LGGDKVNGSLYTFWLITGTNSPDPRDGFQDVRFFLTYSATQNHSNNTSTITVKSYIEYKTSSSHSVTENYGNRFNGTQYNHSRSSSSQSAGSQLLRTNTFTVNHKSDGTGSYTLRGNLSVQFGGAVFGPRYTFEPTITLDTIPRYATITTFNTTVLNPNQISVSWGTNATCDRIRYSTNSGSSWTTASGQSGTSGSFTISGLTANTTYGVRIEVRRTDSQLTTNSSTLSRTTHKLSTLTSSRNFNIGADIPLTIDRQNSNYTHSVRLRCRATSSDSWTTIKTETGVGASGTISLTQGELDTI
jgi:hypothetical protein